jgi:hypothetical protein
VRARVWVVLVAVLALAVALVIACGDGATPTACSNIPKDGCPLSYGRACDDPVYACLPGNRWELRGTCAPRDAGTIDSGGVVVEAGPRDASIDVEGAFGGPGCVDLQPPDCTLGTAVLCPSGCCGCEDLFVCRDGGWSAWGVCGPDGALPN